MDKIKTLILFVLVAASLVQSYFLAYSTPEFEPLNRGEYVDKVIDGTQAKLEDLLYPEQIILHFGKKTHTVLYPELFLNHYRNIFDFLKQRTFDGLRKTNVPSANYNWDDVRDNQQGIEFRFREGIPLDAVQSIMKITKDDSVPDTALITRIWIFENSSRDEVKTFFISDTGGIVFEAARADVTVRDIEDKVRLGESLTKYHTENGDYYLPDQAIPAIQHTAAYTQFTPEQLKQSLFVDPGMTRTLQERDGAQIITDGKKGLQLRTGQHWFAFSDPVSVPVDSKNDMKDNLLSAIQFINQHGGWDTSFLYAQMNPKQPSGPQTFLFRQVLDGMPVINVKQDVFGYMKVVVQKGIISNFERSMLVLNPKSMQKSEAVLPGGKELDQTVANFNRKNAIARVFPGYRPVINDQHIVFVPQWFVELRDGTFDVLE